MAAYPKVHNPFSSAGDEDDDDDVPRSKRGFDFDDGDDDDDDEGEGVDPVVLRQRRLEQQVMRTARSAVDSSTRSVALIHESERVGVQTAEELIRQGEVLKRTERMVDNMEQDMKTSQRHINTIRSVWGGLLTYFKGKPEPVPTQREQPPTTYEGNSRLQNALSEGQTHEENHPNLRKLNTAGFGGSAPSGNEPSYQGGSKNIHLRSAHQQLDNNLDEMCSGLSRLKGLGLGLQAELEDQDVSLDSLLNKVDSMDGRIGSTNRQLQSLK